MLHDIQKQINTRVKSEKAICNWINMKQLSLDSTRLDYQYTVSVQSSFLRLFNSFKGL
jgi:hypothetical protein